MILAKLMKNAATNGTAKKALFALPYRQVMVVIFTNADVQSPGMAFLRFLDSEALGCLL